MKGDSCIMSSPFLLQSGRQRITLRGTGGVGSAVDLENMNKDIDTIQYAMENTKVLREPDRRIDTFSATRFKFVIVSELMDSVGKVRVRRGEVEAQKPQLIKPASYNSVELEGLMRRGRSCWRG